jgi:hypothetical protein
MSEILLGLSFALFVPIVSNALNLWFEPKSDQFVLLNFVPAYGLGDQLVAESPDLSIDVGTICDIEGETFE